MASSAGLEADTKVSKWFKHYSCSNHPQPADRIFLKKPIHQRSRIILIHYSDH